MQFVGIMWKRSERKKRKRKKSDSVSDQSDGHQTEPSINLTSSVLGAYGEVLYGKPAGPTQVFVDEDSEEDDDDDDANDADEVDNRDLKMTTSTPTPIPKLNTNEFSAYMTETNTKLDNIMHSNAAIMQKLSKLDILENKINSLDWSVSNISQKVKELEKKGSEFELSVNYVSGKTDEFQQVLKEATNTINEHKNDIKNLKMEVKSVTEQRDRLKDTVEDLQCRSMKTNLVFTGLAEQHDEDTEMKLRDFLAVELGIDFKIEFGNVHRFGREFNGRPRPIVARFLFHKQLAFVKDRAWWLKGKPYGISEQFPAAVEERRRKLYPVVKQQKAAGNKTKLVRDKLYVNGQLYTGQLAEPAPRQLDDRTYSEAVQSHKGPLLPLPHPAQHTTSGPQIRGQGPVIVPASSASLRPPPAQHPVHPPNVRGPTPGIVPSTSPAQHSAHAPPVRVPTPSASAALRLPPAQNFVHAPRFQGPPPGIMPSTSAPVLPSPQSYVPPSQGQSRPCDTMPSIAPR